MSNEMRLNDADAIKMTALQEDGVFLALLKTRLQCLFHEKSKYNIKLYK